MKESLVILETNKQAFIIPKRIWRPFYKYIQAIRYDKCYILYDLSEEFEETFRRKI